MNSKEALERLKDDIEINYLSTKHSNEKDKSNYLILLSSIEKDLEILECFRKIPKQDLKEFIDWQIRYEKNMNTWLEGCNADLSKEEPTKHLIKIKEWLNEKEKEERVEND